MPRRRTTRASAADASVGHQLHHRRLPLREEAHNGRGVREQPQGVPRVLGRRRHVTQAGFLPQLCRLARHSVVVSVHRAQEGRSELEQRRPCLLERVCGFVSLVGGLVVVLLRDASSKGRAEVAGKQRRVSVQARLREEPQVMGTEGRRKLQSGLAVVRLPHTPEVGAEPLAQRAVRPVLRAQHLQHLSHGLLQRRVLRARRLALHLLQLRHQRSQPLLRLKRHLLIAEETVACAAVPLRRRVCVGAGAGVRPAPQTDALLGAAALDASAEVAAAAPLASAPEHENLPQLLLALPVRPCEEVELTAVAERDEAVGGDQAEAREVHLVVHRLVHQVRGTRVRQLRPEAEDARPLDSVLDLGAVVDVRLRREDDARDVVRVVAQALQLWQLLHVRQLVRRVDPLDDVRVRQVHLGRRQVAHHLGLELRETRDGRQHACGRREAQPVALRHVHDLLLVVELVGAPRHRRVLVQHVLPGLESLRRRQRAAQHRHLLHLDVPRLRLHGTQAFVHRLVVAALALHALDVRVVSLGVAAQLCQRLALPVVALRPLGVKGDAARRVVQRVLPALQPQEALGAVSVEDVARRLGHVHGLGVPLCGTLRVAALQRLLPLILQLVDSLRHVAGMSCSRLNEVQIL
eukprot:Rhum_TRINITY_DN2422_c0_g1::Rhum_TRINITY_DN2422_c0_g1_i1::g.7189::m.7189